MFNVELRHARLLLTRSPVLSAAAILALAVGIAGNSAMFSIVSAVLLRPLPYPHADRVVNMMTGLRSVPGWRGTLSLPEIRAVERDCPSLDRWGIFLPMEGSAIIDGQPLTLRETYISNNVVAATETRPILGIVDAPGSPENPNHIYISQLLWRERFHSDPNIIGKSLVLEGLPRTIRAVLPSGFNIGFGNSQAYIWVPTPVPPNLGPGDHVLFAIGHLRPGATLAQARKEVDAVADELSKRFPDNDRDFNLHLDTLQASVTSDVGVSLWTLLAAVMLVQLIVCTNVAGLLLSRGAERAQQTAIRIALGASLSDIGRQCLAEGLTLALAGGALGLVLGRVLLVFALLLRSHLPVTNPIVFDWRVALFTFALSLLTGILASLAPWWQARFVHGGDLLKEGNRTTSTIQRRRLLRVFAGVEIAVSLILLVGGAVLVGNLNAANHTDLGFNPDDLYMVRLIVPEQRYPDPQLIAYYDRLLKRVSAIPGLEDASLASLFPPDWGNNASMFANGKTNPATDYDFVEQRSVAGDYFRLMGFQTVRGHIPSAAETEVKEPPVLINETAAREFWPHGDALGSRLAFGDDKGPFFRVGGILRDYRNAGALNPVRPEIFFPLRIRTWHHIYLAVRSRLPEARVARLLRDAVLSTDPTVSFSAVNSMYERLGSSVWVLRFQANLLAAFSLFSMLLAVVGVYSVMSYSVSQRSVEIGIRSAMGADPFAALGMIVREGFRLAVVASSAGMLVAVAIAASPGVRDALQIHLHAAPLVGAYFAIIAAGVLATFIPARRAALVDPMIALRPDSPPSLRATLRALKRAPQLLRIHRDRKARPAAFDPRWLTGVAESMNKAQSVTEVLQDGLSKLRLSLGAESAALLVRFNEEILRCGATDGALDSSRVHSLRADAFVVRRLRRMLHPLAFDERDVAAWQYFAERADSETRKRRLDEIATLQAMRSVLLVPVWLRGDLLALLSFGPRATPYDLDDYTSLEIAATQLAFVIENGRLLDRIAAEERTRQELALAARVQRRLFPEKPLHVAQIELAGECQPARTIGGDYYDFLELPDGQIGIALADVAGKGIAAALLTSVVQASVRSLAPDQHRPLSELVKRINQLLYKTTESNSYATFFYAQFDSHSCCLRFVNAGHNPPYFLRSAAGGQGTPAAARTCSVATAAVIEELAAGGPIIGLLPVVAYEEQQIDLASGDLLVAYTDGIPEALNVNDEEYGEDRLRDLVLRLQDRSADEIRRAILDDVRAFIDVAPQYDDMTVLVLKVN